MSDDLLICFF
jgi:periodic tryptophan protein 2